jgi:predicted DNA-binding transcriptional regulator YafY
MRPAERLFDIIQLLRGTSRPLTAGAIATKLEVSTRTIYRDIAALQGSGVPVEGAAGFGYVLGPGYDLPPLMFTAEEFQTIAVALDLVPRTGDQGLQAAAAGVRAKIAAIRPRQRSGMIEAPYYVWTRGATVAPIVCLSEVREAIRARRKLRLDYRNGEGTESCRIVWPLAIAYFADATLIGAWCELRSDYRHFRTDRVRDLRVLEDAYPDDCPTLLSGWRALQEQYAASVLARA